MRLKGAGDIQPASPPGPAMQHSSKLPHACRLERSPWSNSSCVAWLLVLPKKNVCWLMAIVSKKKNGGSAHVALNNREDELAVRLNTRVCVLGVDLHQCIVDALAAAV